MFDCEERISILNLYHPPYSSAPSHQAYSQAYPTIISIPIKESGEATKAMHFLTTGGRVLR
jgi:hypothetical protein